jgi:hypothetical protein
MAITFLFFPEETIPRGTQWRFDLLRTVHETAVGPADFSIDKTGAKCYSIGK